MVKVEKLPGKHLIIAIGEKEKKLCFMEGHSKTHSTVTVSSTAPGRVGQPLTLFPRQKTCLGALLPPFLPGQHGMSCIPFHFLSSE